MAELLLSDAIARGRTLCGACHETHFMLSREDDTLLADIWGCAFIGYLHDAEPYNQAPEFRETANMLMIPPSELRTMLRRCFPALAEPPPESLAKSLDGNRYATLFDHLQVLYDDGWAHDDLLTHLRLVNM